MPGDRKLRLSSGQLVILGSKLGGGGEGVIYRANNLEGAAVKCYHKTASAMLQRKLIAMVQMESLALEQVAAWPRDLVYDKAGNCAGFVMAMVDAPGPIDRLAHPAERAATFPDADYLFMVCVARNLMDAASTLHGHGLSIGDPNESNVMVRRNGTVRFIDTDSFEFKWGGERFPCGVGKSLYVAPELQGADLRCREHQPNHDMFGLSVLAFQLLLFGRHPFAGVPKDGIGRTIEQCIAEGRYAYARGKSTNMDPPPGSLTVAALGELAPLFERAFLTRTRPTAAEVAAGLRRFHESLQPCGSNRRHARIRGLACELCRLPRDPLPSFQPAGPHPTGLGSGDITLEQLLAAARRVNDLQPVHLRLRIDKLTPQERAQAHAPAENPASNGGWWVLAAAVAISLFAGGAPDELRLGILVLGIAVALTVQGHASGQVGDAKRRAAAAKSLIDALSSRESQIQHNAVNLLTSDRHRVGKIQHILQILTSRQQRLSAKLQHADESFRTELRRQFLSQQLIPKAGLSGIGPSRRASLASFGIETAADVKRSAILAIPGFGATLAGTLIAWRKDCEGRMPSSIRHATAPDDWKSRIRAEHAAEIARHAAELKTALMEHEPLRMEADREFNRMAREVDEARQQCRAALSRLEP